MDIRSALDVWSSHLEDWQIVTDDYFKEGIAITTFPTSQAVSAILYPTTTEEVAAILKIANAHNIAVYPTSQGKNYGLGSKVPIQDASVLLDLSKMNKILDFSEDMAYITLQPGVSFKQLFDFLESKKSKLSLDSIGSTKNASIVGNAMERGHGMGVYADRFNFVCGFEVVLPTGEVMKTGFAEKNTEIGALSKWGVGPYLDGLFTQSNLGVVTQLTFWLRPKPNYPQTCIFYIEDDAKMGKVMDKVRKLRLNGLQLSLRVFNDQRMIAFSQNYPWEEMNNEVPLSPKMQMELRERYGIKGKWVALIGLYSFSRLHALAEQEYIRQELGNDIIDLFFYNEDSVAKVYDHSDEATQQQIDFMFSKSILHGHVSDGGINMCYWRKKYPAPQQVDVHRDKCGVLWYCPVVPCRNEDVLKVVEIVERISKQYRLEPNLGFLYISERVMDVTGAICYDREEEGADENAMNCYRALLDAFESAGYPQYRLGIQSMDLMKNSSKSVKTKFLQKIKKTIDPNGILAKGRYI